MNRGVLISIHSLKNPVGFAIYLAIEVFIEGGGKYWFILGYPPKQGHAGVEF
jgi:hypothetical protein